MEYPYKIDHIVVQVSSRCFFRCKMCFQWKQEYDFEINIRKYSDFFSFIKQYKSPETIVVFTGGETLNSPYLIDLIRSASLNGLSTLVNTNGWLLNKKKIEELYDSGLSNILISLDGSCPEVHDKIRGMSGSFNRIMDAIKEIKNYYGKNGRKIMISTNCVISGLNLDDIQNLADIIQANPNFDLMHFQAVTAPFADNRIQNNFITDESSGTKKPWYMHDEFKALWPADKKKLKEAYSSLIYFKNRGSKIGDSVSKLKAQYLYFLNPGKRHKNIVCNTQKDIFIDLEGNVYHCHQKKEKLGNINDYPAEVFWNNAASQEFRKNILSCNFNCHQLLNCGYLTDKPVKDLKTLF